MLSLSEVNGIAPEKNKRESVNGIAPERHVRQIVTFQK
jgi:hypothetical protein